MNNWVKAVLAKSDRLAMPLMTHPGIELSDKKIIDALFQGEIHAMAVCLLDERFPSAAVTTMMDLTVEAEAFGCQVAFSDHEMPKLHHGIIQSNSDINRIKQPELSAGRISEYLKATRMASNAVSSKPVFGGMIGPFSLAGRLYDLGGLMMDCCMVPDDVHKLLELCTQFLITYAKEMKETGCQGIILAEPAAGLLSNEDCQQFSTRYVRQLVDAVQDDEFLLVLHNCGNSGQCTEAMVQSGAGALHVGNAISMTAVLETCPPDVVVMGNIDPVGIMQQSTPEVVFTETMALLERTANYPNFVLSTGCDLPPHVPVENIEAFFKALQHFNGRSDKE